MWPRPLPPDDRTPEIAAWMRELASMPATDAPLPDASYLWWKAELLRRWHAEERTVAALDAAERVQIVVGIACAALLLALAWRNLPALIHDPGAAVFGGIVCGAVVLVCAAAALVRTWRRDEVELP
jgi:hypothetical protein